MSSEAAAELARLRWKKATKAERKRVGAQLRKARMKKTTVEQRREAARTAARARWAAYRAAQKANQ